MYVTRKYYPDLAFYYEGGDGKEVISAIQAQNGTAELKVVGQHNQLTVSVRGSKATLMPGDVMIVRQDSSPLTLKYKDFINKYDIIGDTYVDPTHFKENVGNALHNLTSEVERINFILDNAHDHVKDASDKVKSLVSQQKEYYQALHDATRSLVDHFRDAYEHGMDTFAKDKFVVNTADLVAASSLVEKIRDSLKDIEASRKDFMTGIDVERLQEKIKQVGNILDTFDSAIHSLSMDDVESVKTHMQEQDKTIAELKAQVKALAGRVGALDRNMPVQGDTKEDVNKQAEESSEDNEEDSSESADTKDGEEDSSESVDTDSDKE